MQILTQTSSIDSSVLSRYSFTKTHKYNLYYIDRITSDLQLTMQSLTSQIGTLLLLLILYFNSFYNNIII